MLTKAFILIISTTLVVGTHYWDKEEKHHAPQPYKFGYEVKDKESTQFRHEEGDGHGSVRGSYGYTDDKGHYREVHYVADKQGFRAKVKTNEPGTSNQDPAHVEVVSNAKHHDNYGQHSVKHTPVYHEHHNIKHIPTPVYREHHNYKHIPLVSHHHVKPMKHYSSYNFDNFSPIHGYSYRPSSFLKYKPISGLGSGFGGNFRKHHGGYETSTPLHGSFLGLNHGSSLGLGHGSSLGLGHGSSLGLSHGSTLGLGHGSSLGLNHHGSLFNGLSNLEGLDGYSSSNINKDEIDKLIEEAKHKGQGHYSSNIDGYSGFNNFDGLDGHNNGKIEKIMEDLKHKSQYSGSKNNYNDKNYHIREFRNIGNHKYSRSSDKDY